MTMQRQWNELCARMGVQPKQFGALLAVLAVAVTVLGAKFAFRPGAASAASASAPQVEGTTKAPPAAPTPVVNVTAAPSKRTIVKADLALACERDPFHMWMLPEPAPVAAAPVAAAPTASTPGALPGLPLKAVVRGELAVFGDQTARAGDAVALPDGSFAEVKSIGDRVVTVVWDGRTFDVRFGGSGSPSRAPAAGGFK